jgi:hypothetical protein
MKRKDESLELIGAPFRMFADDVRDIEASIREMFPVVRLKTEHHELDGLQELAELDDPIEALEIEGYDSSEPGDIKSRIPALRLRLGYFSSVTGKTGDPRPKAVAFSASAILAPRRRGWFARAFLRGSLIHPYLYRDRAKGFFREHWKPMVLHTINTTISVGLGYLIATLVGA